MKKIYNLSKIKLFDGINENNIETILSYLSAHEKHYKKGEFIFRIGDTITEAGLLIDGEVHICKEDYWGNLNILNKIGKYEIFGESYAVSSAAVMANNAVAVNNSTIIFINLKNIFDSIRPQNEFNTVLIKNLFEIISAKNRILAQKNGYLSQRTIREKILAYLSDQSVKAQSASFDIPFNRQQLADFLSADRSALSAELGRMRDEGLIIFNKNHFKLIEKKG